MKTETDKSCIIATGLVALDVVVDTHCETGPVKAGGTCGNVLSILAYLGWDACPLARLAPDRAAAELLADLKSLSVNTRFVQQNNFGSTPVIIQYLRTKPDGSRTHSFSMRCPDCRKHFPGYRPVPLRDIEEFENELPEPDVFFFDRISPAALRLAAQFRQRGGVVVFEPSSAGDLVQFGKALELAHIVKYSSDRFQTDEVFWGQGHKPSLVIETLGSRGLRFRTRLGGQAVSQWHDRPSFPVWGLKDSAGAGDWCTAGILHKLAGRGVEQFCNADWDQLCEAISYGQALASWTCWFEGARGGMYEASRTCLDSYVSALLSGSMVSALDSWAKPSETLSIGSIKFCSCGGET